MFENVRRTTVTVAVVLSLCSGASAAPGGFSDRFAFDAALNGPATTVDFDAEAPGSLIAPGGSVDDVTFTYALDGVALKVASVADSSYSTTSPGNFLATSDANIFQDGDQVSLSFPPVNAIGFYLLTRDAMENGDVTLSAGGTSTQLVATAVQGAPLGDGSSVYFLGVVDDVNTFSSATISTPGNGEFLFNIDDIVTAMATDPLSLSLTYAPEIGQQGRFYWWGGLQAAGGLPPYTYDLVGGWIPWPLTLDPATGVILGTPSGPETAYFTVRVTDANASSAIIQSQITVNQAGYVCGACHGATDLQESDE